MKNYWSRRDEIAAFVLCGMLVFGAYLMVIGYAPR